MPINELIFTGLKMKVLLVLLLAMELRVSQADEYRRYLVSKRSVNGPCQEPEPGTPKVGRCTHIAEWNANDCSYPSKPRKLLYTLAFNSTTKSFAVNISWDQPEYGAPLLWGYEVHFNGDCYQIIGNSPGDRRFVFPRKISFSKYIPKYQISISSLPRKERSYKNRVEKDLKLPDKCTTYARYRLKLPLECHSVKNLMVLEPCAVNSSALIKFNSFSENVTYHYEVLSPCTNNQHKLVTENSFPWVDGSTIIQKRIYKLREGCIYTIVVRMYKRMKHDIEISKTTKTTFRCLENPLTTKTPQSPTLKQESNKFSNMYVAIPTGVAACMIFFAVCAVLSRRYFLLKRGRELRLLPYKARINKTGSEMTTGENPVVMIISCHGCKPLDEFVLLLASFLNSNGFHVKLDLLENNAIADNGGLANYLVQGEDEADYVMILCTENTDNSFKFIIDVIRNKMMNQGYSRYVPVYLAVDQMQIVPTCLQSFSCRIPDKLEEIVQRMHGIPPYEIGVLPVRNRFNIDTHSLENLKKAAKNVLKLEHSECEAEFCKKGILANEEFADRTSIDSFIVDALSKGSDDEQDHLSENSFLVFDES